MFLQRVNPLERLYVSEEAGWGLWGRCSLMKESFEKTDPESVSGS